MSFKPQTTGSDHTDNNPYAPPLAKPPKGRVISGKTLLKTVATGVLLMVTMDVNRSHSRGNHISATRISERGYPNWLILVEVRKGDYGNPFELTEIRMDWGNLVINLLIVMTPLWGPVFVSTCFQCWVKFVRWGLKLDDD